MLTTQKLFIFIEMPNPIRAKKKERERDRPSKGENFKEALELILSYLSFAFIYR